MEHIPSVERLVAQKFGKPKKNLEYLGGYSMTMNAGTQRKRNIEQDIERGRRRERERDIYREIERER